MSSNEGREHRITYEIIVDCYDEYEVSMGWYTYLEDQLDFPFEAQWSTATPSTKFSKPETVQAVGMADAEDCKTDILVEIEYRDGAQTDMCSVPLTEIQLLESDTTRARAIEDWQYWIDQGNRLVNPDEEEEY